MKAYDYIYYNINFLIGWCAFKLLVVFFRDFLRLTFFSNQL